MSYPKQRQNRFQGTVGVDPNQNAVSVDGTVETTIAAGDAIGITDASDVRMTPAKEHITAASPHAARLSTGSAFYDALSDAQLRATPVDTAFQVASSTNNTTTPLSGGATYTGTAELSRYPDVLVTCKADVAGTLYLDFSDTGSYSGEQSTLTFTVRANVYEFHTAVKGLRYCRARYTNGSSAQSSFRLNTYFGAYAKQPSAPLSLGVSMDADSTVVRSVDQTLDIARGGFADITYINKFGRNPSVGTATDPEEIWATGGAWVPPTATRTMIVTSSSVNDTSAGSGAQTISISGLDGNWNEASETITMNGTANVNSSGTYRRINRVRVVTAGSSGVNEGTITVTAQTDATVQASVTIGYGQSTMAIYTIPAGYTAYLTSWHVDLYQTTATTKATCALVTRPGVDTATAPINVKGVCILVVGGTTSFERNYNPYLRIEEKTDVFLRVLEVSANSCEFTGEFDIMLVRN